MRTIFGTPSLTMTEAVDNLMALQQNERRSHYASLLIAAKWVWIDLLKNTIWMIRQVYINVDPITRQLNLPGDLSRLINLSVVDDCKRIQPLFYDPNIQTIPKAISFCGCENCKGKGTLCGLIDEVTMRTEQVDIDGTNYVRRIYNQKGKGCLFQVTESPRLNADGDIEYDIERERLCDLDTDETGCIKDTLGNNEKINQHCGCFIVSCQRKMCDNIRTPHSLSDMQNKYGGWKNTDCGLVKLDGLKYDQVIITYQSTYSDSNAEEILIPQYAMEAFMHGVNHYSIAFNRSEAIGSKRMASDTYQRAKTDLRRYLNPINMSDFADLQSIIPQW